MKNENFPEMGNMELYPRDKLETKVFRQLSKFGISANLKGYSYLSCAVVSVYYDREKGERIMKCLYPEIAEKFGTTVGGVEHSVRTALAKFKFGTVNVEYLGISYDENLTAKKFINKLVNKLYEETAEDAKKKKDRRQKKRG